jgi:hypothetical protein
MARNDMWTKKEDKPTNLQEKIQKKAYELFEKRGCLSGDDLTDWLEAEKIIKSKNR